MKIVKIHSRKRLGMLYSTETGYGGLAAILAGKLLRLPVVIHSHTQRSKSLKNIRKSMDDFRTWPYWALENSIDHFVVTHADGAVAVSRQIADFLEWLGMASSRIIVVSSAVEIEEYRRPHEILGRWRSGFEPNTFVIGYIGRLERLKGIETLVEGFADFAEKSAEPSILLIAGDGVLREELIHLASEHRLTNVRFLGFQDDSAAFLASIDVFVLPSFSEGSPISLLEAMASGCAIVATDIPAISEITGDSIRLFRPGDKDALSSILSNLRNDPALRQRMASAVLEISQGFSPEVVFPRIIGFCLSIFQGNVRESSFIQ